MRTKQQALVDTHCHIDLYENPVSVVAEAEAQSVYTIAVTNAPSVFRHTAMLVANAHYVRPAVGLHPQLVHSHGHEVMHLRPLLKETRYVGEIGLDYTTEEGTKRRVQREVLSQILAWCAEYQDKVLTLHSRKAASDVIKAVGPGYPGRIILHWFSGTLRELEQAIEYGMYFSVNSAMVESKKGRQLISRMPMKRVCTESDGPFVKLRSRPAKPYDTEHTLEGLAALWQVSAHEARETVLANFRCLLR